MTRLLVASIYYAPDETGIAPYTAELCEHLAGQGYEVTALTGMPHYPAWRIDQAYRGRMEAREFRGGVRVLRRAHYIPSRHTALHRLAYEASFLASGLAGLRIERPHAVIGVVPSLGGGVLARVAAARYGIPYGIIMQDLVGAAAEQSGAGGGFFVTGAIRAAERLVMRNAASVAIVAEGFRPYVESLGVSPSRVRRARNWARTQPSTLDRAAARERFGLPRDATICLHAGNMGQKQGLETVLKCATLAREDKSLLFAFAGDGHQRPALEAMVRERQLGNVRFLGVLPGDAFPHALAAADMLLLNQRGSVRDMALPSKLTAYFAARRPVVASVHRGSEAAREVGESGGGIVVRPDDAAALLGAICRVGGDDGLAAHLAERGAAWAATALSKGAALRSYEQFVASVLAGAHRGRVHTAARTRRTVTTRPNEHRRAA
jgi:glycosyltransferase involved in cell wall biosynthesis